MLLPMSLLYRFGHSIYCLPLKMSGISCIPQKILKIFLTRKAYNIPNICIMTFIKSRGYDQDMSQSHTTDHSSALLM